MAKTKASKKKAPKTKAAVKTKAIGPLKRGRKKKGVANHCSVGDTLNANEMRFCVVYAETQSIAQTAKLLKINYMTARIWLAKPKIEAEWQAIYKEAKDKAIKRGTDEMATDVMYIGQLARERTIEILKSPRDDFRGFSDVNTAVRNGMVMERNLFGDKKGAPFVQVNVQNNQNVADPALQKTLSEQVYMPPELRKQYGISDSPSDAVDAHFAAIDAQRREAVAARAATRGTTPTLGA